MVDFLSTNKANESPLKERFVRKTLRALLDKTKGLESRQVDSSQTLRQMYSSVLAHRNLCLSCMTLVMMFGKSPWARLSSK